jgi:hypothetical protein
VSIIGCLVGVLNLLGHIIFVGEMQWYYEHMSRCWIQLFIGIGGVHM